MPPHVRIGDNGAECPVFTALLTAVKQNPADSNGLRADRIGIR
jgi:hypothetical protein